MAWICGCFGFDVGQPCGEKLDQVERSLSKRAPNKFLRYQNDKIDFRGNLSGNLRAETRTEQGRPKFHNHDFIIVADARLDNREEMIGSFGFPVPFHKNCTDDAIILAAYKKWGESCLHRIQGDYAFAIYDRAKGEVFVARDPLGMRSIAYHQSNSHFIFSSDARSIFEFSPELFEINIERLLDFQVEILEGADLESTFYKNVFRVPPGHFLKVNVENAKLKRWFAPPQDELLNFRDPREYTEAFISLFQKSVKSKLRGQTKIGAMLSGGLDSSSVVHEAARQMHENAGSALKTYSAIDSSNPDCIETNYVMEANRITNIDATFIDVKSAFEEIPGLFEDAYELREPFDFHMTMIRAIYKKASLDGVNAVLDGVGGDALFLPGNPARHYLKRGQPLTAWKVLQETRKAGVRNRQSSALGQYLTALVADTLPSNPSSAFRKTLIKVRAMKIIRKYSISSELAEQGNLSDRLERFYSHRTSEPSANPVVESWMKIQHTFNVVGRERYNRVACDYGIETLDPYFDMDLVRFCCRLPYKQKVDQGLSKFLLRQVLKNKIGDKIINRNTRQHLGHKFNKVLVNRICMASKIGDRSLDRDESNGFLKVNIDPANCLIKDEITRQNALALDIWAHKG